MTRRRARSAGISDHSAAPSVIFSYFDLYPYERVPALVADCAAAGAACLLGQTLDGHELDVVEVGSGPLHCWVIHRQHPGESQASFYAEGLLHRLLGLRQPGGAVDGLARRLLSQFTFHIVPNMNPDGAVRGHLRTNACGANLNREWCTTGDYEAPTLARSPEVFHTLAAMDRTGVDLFVDVHGDEALPFAFLAGSEGLPAWSARLKALHGAFLGAYCRANPDMQAEFGYDPDRRWRATWRCAEPGGPEFDCLGVTLEMPFKVCASTARST